MARITKSEKNSKRKNSKRWLDSISLLEAIGCIVVLGYLTVFIIMAVRLPPENLLEVFKTAASPLSILIGALFGAKLQSDKNKDR